VARVARSASATLAGGGTAALLLATRPGDAPAASPAPSAAAASAPATTVVTRINGADAIAAVAAATEPSVVTISGATGRFQATSGSGIVVSNDGLILTTAIVAPSDTTYTVLLADDHETTARVVASDPAHGLVLLRADASGLTPARLGSSANLSVGQLVVAIGSPLGEFTDTVTSGIVSSLDRSIDVTDPSSGVRVALDGLIQTDAAINAGSSGGPLLDATGSVIGVIATSASDGQGIGFAIPIASALELISRAEA
jgi:putative serine protease PepD